MVLFCRGIKTQHVFELNYKQMWYLDIKIKKKKIYYLAS